MKHQAFCLFVPPCLFVPLFLANFVVAASLAAAEPFRWVEDNAKKQLSLSDGILPVLTYQYGVIEHEQVPLNDSRRFAGCYIHPLHGLRGEILTDNIPADHYHHRGVFWVWPHVGLHEVDGRVTAYNLWERNAPLTQHFVRWMSRSLSDQTAMFEVENGWFIGDPQEGKKIMSERVKVTVHRVQHIGDVPSRSIDFEYLWQPTDKPITLRGSEGKSYGGFTVRFQPFIPETERSNRNALARQSDINRIMVPSGIAEGDLPDTPLAWAGYTSAFGDQPPDGEKQLSGAQLSGAVIFIPKTHPDFPPSWLTRYYGPLCVGWPGVDGRTFQPGEEIKLRYRMWIHDGAVTVPQIEKAYEMYHEE